MILMNNKVFRNIKKILNIIVITFIILFLLVVLLQRVSNNTLSLFGFRMFTVISGSMEPKYKIGDVLISKKLDPSKIEVGDAITYLGEKGNLAGKVVTHEVIRIEKDSDDKYIFETQGVANDVPDPIVYEHQIYGKVIYKSIIISFIYKIVMTKFGMFFLIFIPILYIIGSELLTVMLEKEEKRRKKA